MPSFKEEFKLVNFGLKHDKPYEFARSQWTFSHKLYIAWRIFWALFHTGWLIRSVQVHISDENDPKWLIFLTNWAYLFLTLQSWMSAGVVLYHTKQGHTEPEHFGDASKWYHKVLWHFTTVAYDVAIIVTLLYWTLVFEELERAVSIMTHAVNTFYVVTDTMLSSTPYRLLHAIYVVIYGAAYVTFSIIYHVADGTNEDDEPYIYESLDWSKTGGTAALAIGVVVVAMPLAHLFIYGLTKLRVSLSKSQGDNMEKSAVNGNHDIEVRAQ